MHPYFCINNKATLTHKLIKEPFLTSKSNSTVAPLLYPHFQIHFEMFPIWKTGKVFVSVPDLSLCRKRNAAAILSSSYHWSAMAGPWSCWLRWPVAVVLACIIMPPSRCQLIPPWISSYFTTAPLIYIKNTCTNTSIGSWQTHVQFMCSGV